MIQQQITTDIPATWKVIDITISGIGENLQAIINYQAIDAEGNIVKEHTVIKKGIDFNSFWANFNTGGYLYEVLKSDLALSGAIDANVENEFLNPVV